MTLTLYLLGSTLRLPTTLLDSSLAKRFRRRCTRRTTGVGLKDAPRPRHEPGAPDRPPEASVERLYRDPFLQRFHSWRPRTGDIGFMPFEGFAHSLRIPVPKIQVPVHREQENPRGSSPHFAAPCGVLGGRARCAADGTDCLLRFDRVRFPQLAVGTGDPALVQVIRLRGRGIVLVGVPDLAPIGE